MDRLEQAINQRERIHFIGIGGVMMSSLALELARRGCQVTGNDRSASANTDMLNAAGIPVEIGHRPEFVEGAAVIVKNAAIGEASPDLAAARAANLPVYERPQILGRIMREYERSIGVSGTHGKSTTSGMLTHALRALSADPTAFLGASLAEIGGTYVLGSDDWFVAESCEYCRSFLYLRPQTAVILNVEADHLDYYSGIEEIIGAFRDFAENTPEVGGKVVVNADSANAMRAVDGVAREIVTFGLENGEITATELCVDHGCWSYTLTAHGRALARVQLALPGKHNVANSLAVAATLIAYGFAPEAIATAIGGYTGVARRFERLGTYNGAVVIDDYAHHPDELETTIATARSYGYNRVICLFQPHTYSRTAALKDRFCEVLGTADLAVLTDIFSAREQNTFGISSADLADAVEGARYASTLTDAAEVLAELAAPGDMILVCGAGDVNRAAHLLLNK
ncbi:MAG: UDP-N-acetylmuramate--L-alanine ligase [Clostridia bacterium]|nr:UDP-N-acetylmuramate--L-alanine ligase [Clostridia bacterium]